MRLDKAVVGDDGSGRGYGWGYGKGVASRRRAVGSGLGGGWVGGQGGWQRLKKWGSTGGQYQLPNGQPATVVNI